MNVPQKLRPVRRVFGLSEPLMIERARGSAEHTASPDGKGAAGGIDWFRRIARPSRSAQDGDLIIDKKILPGKPYPLGATYDGKGINSAIYSETASDIELCLFDKLGEPQTASFRLPEFTRYVRHGYLPGL
jgi:hypothetical protein